MKDFLPVGSVVTLKEPEDRTFAIVGFCQALPGDDTELFDYAAVPYPYGYINSEILFLFNNDQIDEVRFTGYLNELGTTFSSEISEVTDKIRKGEIPRD